MAKINRELKARKDAALMELFKADPTLSIPKANAAMKAQFGQAVNNQRVYQIRGEARAALAKGEHREAGRIMVGEGRKRLITLEGSERELEFLRSAVKDLQRAGSSVAVAHRGHNYVVLRP
jgi:hypothetical protein